MKRNFRLRRLLREAFRRGYNNAKRRRRLHESGEAAAEKALKLFKKLIRLYPDIKDKESPVRYFESVLHYAASIDDAIVNCMDAVSVGDISGDYNEDDEIDDSGYSFTSGDDEDFASQVEDEVGTPDWLAGDENDEGVCYSVISDSIDRFLAIPNLTPGLETVFSIVEENKLTFPEAPIHQYLTFSIGQYKENSRYRNKIDKVLDIGSDW